MGKASRVVGIQFRWRELDHWEFKGADSTFDFEICDLESNVPYSECANPLLLKFQGRPSELSPRARMMTTFFG